MKVLRIFLALQIAILVVWGFRAAFHGWQADRAIEQAQQLWAEGQLNKAILRLQATPPSQARVPYTLGRLHLSRYLLEGQPTDLALANGRFLEAAQRNPQEGLYLAGLGQVELLAGQAQQAEPWFRQALERDPHNQDYLYGLGETLEALGQSKEAVKVYRQGRRIKADPRFSAGLARLGVP